VGCGTVYHLTPSGSGFSEQLVYDFTDSTLDGEFPSSGIVADGSGNLYGSSSTGIYELTPSSPAYTFLQLHPFTKNETAAGLLLMKGNIYFVSGSSVKELHDSTAGYSERTIYTFTKRAQGAEPNSPLIANSAGALFGSTYTGGVANCGSNEVQACGTVFEITP
jgi:hypothetical protein